MNAIRMLTLTLCLAAAGCAGPGYYSPYYNTQKGAVIGGGLGALTGQAIGRDTQSTLLGAGVGTLLGVIAGNAVDQHRALTYGVHPGQTMGLSDPGPIQEPVRYAAPVPQVLTEPPGEWVTISGHWEGNRWVPEHQEWRPVDPR